MNGGSVPVLHALAVEPRVARPGEIVRILFSTPNLGAFPSPAGTVRFRLADGLEALDGLEVVADSAAPGERVRAELRARVSGAPGDGTCLRAEATLALPGGMFETNVCIVTVRSAPLLGGAASGVFLEQLDEATIRVRAVVANEGDGPARDVRVVVPAPPGCVPLDGGEPEVVQLACLDAGERASLSFDVRIAAARPAYAAEDAYLVLEDGTRCGLPSRTTLTQMPALAVPLVTLATVRHRVDVTIDVGNDGWADARDVPVEIALPHALRILEGTLLVDGIPRTPPARRAKTMPFALTIPRVPARSAARITFAAHVPAACDDVRVCATVADREGVASAAAARTRALRLRIVDAPRTISAGGCAVIAAELTNAGDLPEQVRVAIDGPFVIAESEGFAERALAPGACRIVRCTVHPLDTGEDDDALSLVLVASDAAGERTREQCTFVVRDRAWLMLAEPPARERDSVRYVVRNAGTTTACDPVARAGDEVCALPSLAPGERAAFTLPLRATTRGAAVFVRGRSALALPPLDMRGPAHADAILSAPDAIVAGAACTLRLEIALHDDVETLALRAAAPPGARYVAGSTVLDGHALLDRGGAPPLAGDGLVLRAIPAGTRIALAWSVIADEAPADAQLDVVAAYVVDGDTRTVAAPPVHVRAHEPFAARPAGLAYHVDACTLDAPQPSAAGPSSVLDVLPAFPLAATMPYEERGVVLGMRLDDARAEHLTRLLRVADGNDLAAHVLAVRAFFPEREASGDDAIAAALDAARVALGNVFDRLLVKRRIPEFLIIAADCEDAALRASLVTLFERLQHPGVPGDTDDTQGVRTAPLDCEALRARVAACTDAPYGAPEMLRALVALLPTRCTADAGLEAALTRYAGALDAALAPWEGAPVDAFDDALARDAGNALEGARAAVLVALRARTLLSGAA